MSRMLASVTDPQEALIALESGADIIDLKNPTEGALGALSLATIARIVDTVAGRRPVSATVGDLPMDPAALVSAVRRTSNTRVDIVKVGFFGQEGHEACIQALQPWARQARIVAVLFADQAPDLRIVSRLSQAGFYGVMLDTAVKDGKSLRHHLGLPVLQRFVDDAKSHGLLTGLAGSLKVDDLSGLLPLNADYLGFRGALCGGADRTSRLERERFSHVLNVLHSCNTFQEELAG